jgi:hypothetical protein
VGAQDSFYLTQFSAIAANLDLMINSSGIDDRPVKARQVAGAVETCSRLVTERMWDKPPSCKIRPAKIARVARPTPIRSSLHLTGTKA